MLLGGSKDVIKILKPKSYAVFVNIFRGRKDIYGTVATMKSKAKMLRGNILIGIAHVVILSWLLNSRTRY